MSIKLGILMIGSWVPNWVIKIQSWNMAIKVQSRCFEISWGLFSKLSVMTFLSLRSNEFAFEWAVEVDWDRVCKVCQVVVLLI